MNPYLSYVQSIADGVSEAKSIAVSGARPHEEKPQKALLFSPHPDDECIVGLLPLRLQQELDYQIINIPMTFGSKESRRAERLTELEKACAYLGWGNHRACPDLENLTAEDVVTVLTQYQPSIIFCPHDSDWNSRHIEVHHTVMEALQQMPADFSCVLAETEFWGAMDDPNAHVEASIDHVADLVAATSLHTEEVARNPYHLRLPAWMQDNVRRGAELVGGQGQLAPDFTFSTLYRIRRWKEGEICDIFVDGQKFPADGKSLKILT